MKRLDIFNNNGDYDGNAQNQKSAKFLLNRVEKLNFDFSIYLPDISVIEEKSHLKSIKFTTWGNIRLSNSH